MVDGLPSDMDVVCVSLKEKTKYQIKIGRFIYALHQLENFYCQFSMAFKSLFQIHFVGKWIKIYNWIC